MMNYWKPFENIRINNNNNNNKFIVIGSVQPK
jgi:hypothetical protein